jgi:formylglycine-generating enzyme required for sulfatase activity
MNTKKKFFISPFLILGICLMLTYSCKKNDDPAPTGPVPVLTTATVTNITHVGAKCGGNITSDGGATVTARGVCWSTGQTPTIVDSKTTDGGGAGNFTSTITGLSAETSYYVRAYATNANGTGYGAAMLFQTNIAMVSIPAGTFTMGSPTTEVNHESDETQYQVTLSAFYMSKFEISNAQFAAFLNAKNIGSDGLYASGAYPTQALIYASYGSYDWGLHYSGTQWIPVAGYENHPVIIVTWYGATEFATFVGGRLPTEAEWEYACRGGNTAPFNTGGCLTNAQANYDWAYPYSTCSGTITTYPGKTQAIGLYSPNVFGLYDMHGNVWEWCSDWYGAYPTTAQNNPTGANTGSFRVFRGGSWYNDAQLSRSANREGDYPEGHYYTLGIRVAFVP